MPRNTINFMSLAALLLLAGTGLVAHADGLADSRPVMLNQASSASLPVVDRVVVRKSARQLLLMHGGNVVRSYHIQLGLNPVGQKERSGDFRTPEGSYRLDAPQSAQRLLPVDQGVLPERRGSAGARAPATGTPVARS